MINKYLWKHLKAYTPNGVSMGYRRDGKAKEVYRKGALSSQAWQTEAEGHRRKREWRLQGYGRVQRAGVSGDCT